MKYKKEIEVLQFRIQALENEGTQHKMENEKLRRSMMYDTADEKTAAALKEAAEYRTLVEKKNQQLQSFQDQINNEREANKEMINLIKEELSQARLGIMSADAARLLAEKDEKIQ